MTTIDTHRIEGGDSQEVETPQAADEITRIVSTDILMEIAFLDKKPSNSYTNPCLPFYWMLYGDRW